MFETQRADWYFIIPTTIIWLLALVVTAWNFLQIQQDDYRFGFANLVGLSAMLTGIVIRRWAKRDLGKHFSSGLRTLSDHQLITTGIYKRIRYPAYSGNFLFWLGVPLLFSSLYGFLFMLSLIPGFLYRMKIEENMLVEKFGDGYRDYMKHSKRLIPYIY